MIIQIFYKSRRDGKIKLVKRIDGVYAADGKTVIPTGFKIRQVGTGELFDEAIDPVELNRQYTETDEPIENDADQNETILKEKAAAYDILMGVEE